MSDDDSLASSRNTSGLPTPRNRDDLQATDGELHALDIGDNVQNAAAASARFSVQTLEIEYNIQDLINEEIIARNAIEAERDLRITLTTNRINTITNFIDNRSDQIFANRSEFERIRIANRSLLGQQRQFFNARIQAADDVLNFDYTIAGNGVTEIIDKAAASDIKAQTLGDLAYRCNVARNGEPQM